MSKIKKMRRRQADQGEGSPAEPRSEDDAGSGLRKLRKAWRKASEEERVAFLTEAHPELARLLVRSGTDYPPSPIANGRYLLSPTVRRIEQVMIRRRLSPEALMAEIGFEGTGRHLAKALYRGASLRLAVVAALEEWLPEQERQLQQDMQKPPHRPIGSSR